MLEGTGKARGTHRRRIRQSHPAAIDQDLLNFTGEWTHPVMRLPAPQLTAALF